VQSHKCLYNAWLATKPDGVIVLMAPCPEGYGSENFTKWIELGDEQAILNELCKHSEINGQTALSTLMRGRQAVCVSEMSREDVEKLNMTWAASTEEAVELALARLASEGIVKPKAYIMPDAGLTVPMCG
jgi:nickel-dependent lactate racemase